MECSVTPESEIRRRLTIVTFVSTVLVVLCHLDDFALDASPLLSYMGSTFSDSNTANFFLLSGYFLARHFRQDNWYRNAIEKRCCTLLVPYVAWNFLIFGLVACGSFVKFILGRGDLGVVQILSADDFGLTRVLGLGVTLPPYDFPLWYIKSLFLFVLLSPLFFKIISVSRMQTVVLMSILLIANFCVFAFALPQLRFFSFGFPLQGLFFFMIGASIAIRQWPQLVVPSRFLALISVVLWIVVSWLAMFLPRSFQLAIRPCYVVFAVFAIHVMAATVRGKLNNWAASSSFILYAAHYPLLQYTAFMGPWKSFVFTVIVSISVSILVHRFLPRLARLLTGGR